MNFVPDAFDRWTLAAVLSWTARATVVLVLGAAVAFILRGRSAATRHFVWLLTLVGALGVTAVGALPLGLAVRVPGWMAVAVEGSSPGRSAATLPATVAGSFESTDAVPDDSDPLVSEVPAARPELGALAAALWLWGACAVLAWFVLGHLLLAWLSRRAAPPPGEAWYARLDHLARASGLGTLIRLRLSHAVGTPLVCGVVRPVIVLPVDAASWSEERSRVVLLHEIAHVARRDALAQWVACLACSVHWFNPLAWYAARRLRAESERACDDRVLSTGISAPDYASHLLDLVRRARALRLTGSVAIAMARRSTLEGRLLALLDERTRRGRITVPARALGIAALMVTVLGLGLVRPAVPVASAYRHSESDAKKVARTEDEVGMASWEREVSAKRGETLELDLDTGGSVSIRGWDENRVAVRGALGGPDWRYQELELVREGSRVILRVWPEEPDRRTYSTSNRFTIQVPRRFDVRVQSAGGGLTIRDLEGSLRGNTGGGDLVIERVKGHASLSTGGGEIHVTNCDLSGSVSTGGGLVMLSGVRGGLRGSSGSGPVIYAESAEGTGSLADLDIDADGGSITYRGGGGAKAGGMLHVSRAGGEIRLKQAPHGVEANTGGGDIEIGPSGGPVDATTGGGDIDIGPAAASVSAGTGAGDVRVTLARGSADRQVKIHSGSGDIVLELPAGLAVDLDLETAYTRENRPSIIRSQVPVQTEPTTDWDDSEGTPRRYVRARATNPNGVRVRVKTVNGNIEVRKAP